MGRNAVIVAGDKRGQGGSCKVEESCQVEEENMVPSYAKHDTPLLPLHGEKRKATVQIAID